ncbi:MAG: NAD-dependent epimerase/dehydratase family protein [Methylocella sp.]
MTASAIDMERLVADSGLRWTILRDGALYGPHTSRDEMWRSQARAGELEMPGDGSDYILLVHVADLAHAFVLAVEQTQASAILSVVDDAPTTYREILTYIARLEGGPDPKRGANTPLPSFRISNARHRRYWVGGRAFKATARALLGPWNHAAEPARRMTIHPRLAKAAARS